MCLKSKRAPGILGGKPAVRPTGNMQGMGWGCAHLCKDASPSGQAAAALHAECLTLAANCRMIKEIDNSRSCCEHFLKSADLAWLDTARWITIAGCALPKIHSYAQILRVYGLWLSLQV